VFACVLIVIESGTPREISSEVEHLVYTEIVTSSILVSPICYLKTIFYTSITGE
jgi:hypothetical protein